MRQTVVGVFETSDEARRAQAALLDAQFRPASIRVSAGGTPRGVDDGMAYPSNAGIGGDFLTAPPASPLSGAASTASARSAPGLPPTEAHRGLAEEEGPLERVSAFFRDLFSPEDQSLEMARYEEAVRRGGTLVAVDTEDDLEESLASDILIRAGAYDIEERAQSWGRPDYAAEEAIAAGIDDLPGSVEGLPGAANEEYGIARPVMSRAPAGARAASARPAADPGNVTSMDPSDPTGYVASRSDTVGSGMPSGTVVRPQDDVDALPPGPVHTRPFGEGLASPTRAYDDRRDPLDAGRSESEWMEGDTLESDRLEVYSTAKTPTEADRLESDLIEARTMSLDRQGMNAAGAPLQPRSTDNASVRAARGADRMSPYMSEADRMESEQLEAARLEADRIEADRQEAARLDVARRETSSAEAAHRAAQRRQAERIEAERGRMSMGGSGVVNPEEAVVSSREADHLLRSAEEVFVDDAGFPSRREETVEAAAAQRQDRSPISRHVRIYSRRADDPAAIRGAAVGDDRMAASTARNLPLRETNEVAPDDLSRFSATETSTPPEADPATDMRAELGLRSPLDDQRTSRRQVLDDGAPFASDPYDDGRRYASGSETEEGTQTGFVDARDPHPLSDADGSEWDHLKRVVRDAWHRVTGHH